MGHGVRKGQSREKLMVEWHIERDEMHLILWKQNHIDEKRADAADYGMVM